MTLYLVVAGELWLDNIQSSTLATRCCRHPSPRCCRYKSIYLLAPDALLSATASAALDGLPAALTT